MKYLDLSSKKKKDNQYNLKRENNFKKANYAECKRKQKSHFY
jgi:hypothetical protein